MDNQKLEPKPKKTRKHIIYSHPIIGMVASVLFVELISVLCSVLYIIMAALITNNAEQAAESIGSIQYALVIIIASLLVLLIHQWWFRGELHDFFSCHKLGSSLLLGWSSILIPLVLLALNLMSGEMVLGSFTNALILGLQPGIFEEVSFRVLPISIAMRSKDREKLIPVTIILTSVLFGLVHSFNVLAGADPVNTVIQVIYAAAIGFLFGAIYMRTGNLWITMILHSLTDIIAFWNADLQNTGGVLTTSQSTSENIFLIIITIVYFCNALYIFRKEKREEIPAIWEQKWQ